MFRIGISLAVDQLRLNDGIIKVTFVLSLQRDLPPALTTPGFPPSPLLRMLALFTRNELL